MRYAFDIIKIIPPTLQIKTLQDSTHAPNLQYMNILYYMMMNSTPQQQQENKYAHELTHKTLHHFTNSNLPISRTNTLEDRSSEEIPIPQGSKPCHSPTHTLHTPPCQDTSLQNQQTDSKLQI